VPTFNKDGLVPADKGTVEVQRVRGANEPLHADAHV